MFGNQQCHKHCISVANMKRNIFCGPLRERILFAYLTNFIANFEKNLHSCSYYKNVRQCEIGNCVKFFLPPCFLQVQKYKQFYNFQSIEASVLVELPTDSYSQNIGQANSEIRLS